MFALDHITTTFNCQHSYEYHFREETTSVSPEAASLTVFSELPEPREKKTSHWGVDHAASGPLSVGRKVMKMEKEKKEEANEMSLFWKFSR